MIVRFVQRRFHYAWAVAAATFFVLLAVNGIRSSPGVFIVPIEREFHWSPALVSLAVSVNVLLYGLVGPFAAALMDRFGMRRVMIIALSVILVGLAGMTAIHAAWQLILCWGLLIGLGAGAVANVLAAIIATRWFVERRGQVMGVLAGSLSAGRLVFLPLLAALVVAGGWRTAMVAGAIGAAIVLPLAGFIIHRDPGDLGLRPYGATEDVPPAPRTVGNPFTSTLATLRSCVGSRQYWLLAGSFFICGATTNGLIGTHFIPAAIDNGYSEVTAASLLAMVGVFDLVGITASGWLSDRVDNRRLLAIYYAGRGVALVVLPFALRSNLLGLTAFGVVYGLDWVATVPPTMRLTADIFGKPRVGVVYGWITAGHQLGSAVAAFGAGLIRTWLGSYEVAFISAGLLCMVAAVLVSGILSPEERRRLEPALTA